MVSRLRNLFISPLLGRDVSDRGRELRMDVPINRPVSDSRAGGIFAKVVVAFPVLRWSDRSGHEAAAPIRADVVQDRIDTCRAERAFIGADARLKRIRRQRLVAILASRS